MRGKHKRIEIKKKSDLGTHLREGCFILILAFSVYLFIALLSYHRTDPSWSHIVGVKKVENLTGEVGAWISDFFLYMTGYLAYFFPVMLSFIGWVVFSKRYAQQNEPLAIWFLVRFVGFLLLLLSGTGLAVIHSSSSTYLPFNAGGILGTVVTQALLPICNRVGTILILFAFLMIGITLFTSFSWFWFLEILGRGLIRFVNLFDKGFTLKKFFFIQINKKEITSPKIKQVEPEHLSQISKPKIDLPKLDLDTDFKTPKFNSSTIIPDLSLLDKPVKNHMAFYSEEELQQRSKELELRLADFGVRAHVVAVNPGPVVTRFELHLAAGTKVSRVTNLVKDLARSLSVISVRVVEVIPGKSAIGVELPNKVREVVTLYEVLATKQYQNARSSLTLALGKDIGGHPVIVDLAKMPHLLVAGTTGSGKSVSLNAMLLSLLYKTTPKNLRLILIDPKMLELSVYEGIPHLLTPVVTDMKDAALALRWCVSEMDRRYRLMASLGVRNILGYNAKVREASEVGAPLLDQLSNGRDQLDSQELPHIVVIADEFADMMVVVGKKVETLIVRLAQKARAAGIHLIFATQRPSVDVITGLIKANIPTRVAFQVSSKIDSRTILDQQGAEQLLGHGDLLYLAPGTGVPVRVHGPYVKDEEVHRVAEYLKNSSEPNYVAGILDEMEQNHAEDFGESSELDPLYDQAVEAIIRSRRVSISSIQRRFKIGYNRAARIVEAMERAGVVSPMENNGAREVLVPSQEN